MRRLFWCLILLAVACSAADEAPQPLAPRPIEDYAEKGPHGYVFAKRDWVDADRGGRPVTTAVWEPGDDVALRGLVVLSHGSMSAGEFHQFLGKHLAGHGFLVFGPNHYGDTLGTPAASDVYVHRVRDLQFALDQAAADPKWKAAVEAGVAAVGHSIGGFDALAVCGAMVNEASVDEQCAGGSALYCNLGEAQAEWGSFRDARVDTCIGLTPFNHPIFGETGAGAATLAVPTLLLGATKDRYLPLEPYLRNFYGQAPEPESVLVEFDGAGHLDFTDFLRDGTLPHAQVKAMTNAYVLAWLEWKLAGDEQAGLQFREGTSPDGEWGAVVTVK